MAGSEKDIASRFQRSQDHHEAYLRLIRWELEDELAMTEERLRNWSDKKLEANGIALFGLSAKTDGWLFGQRVIRFRRGAGRGLGSHRFRQGDIIMLSRSNPLTEKPIRWLLPSLPLPDILPTRWRKRLRICDDGTYSQIQIRLMGMPLRNPC